MPVWYLVPDGVVQYIEKRGLYRAALRDPPDGVVATAGTQGRRLAGPHATPTSPAPDLQEVPR